MHRCLGATVREVNRSPEGAAGFGPLPRERRCRASQEISENQPLTLFPFALSRERIERVEGCLELVEGGGGIRGLRNDLRSVPRHLKARKVSLDKVRTVRRRAARRETLPREQRATAVCRGRPTEGLLGLFCPGSVWNPVGIGQFRAENLNWVSSRRRDDLSRVIAITYETPTRPMAAPRPSVRASSAATDLSPAPSKRRFSSPVPRKGTGPTTLRRPCRMDPGIRG